MPSYREKRQNSRAIITGGTIPYHVEWIAPDLNLIYMCSLPVTMDSIGSGVNLTIYSTTLTPVTVTIGLANHRGRVIKHSRQTTTMNVPVSTDDGTTLSFPFHKKVELKKNKTYFILVQFRANIGEALLVYFSNDHISKACFVLPLCSSVAGNLSTIKNISPPTTFVNRTAPSGNLY